MARPAPGRWYSRSAVLACAFCAIAGRAALAQVNPYPSASPSATSSGGTSDNATAPEAPRSGSPIESTAAAVQQSQPSTFSNVRIGNLGTQFGPAMFGQAPYGQTPTPVAPGITVTPSIGIQEILTDNTNDTNHPKRGDLITQISPSVLVNLDTPRLQGNLAYAPVGWLYALGTQRNYIFNELNGGLTATLIPDELFVDLRGYATRSSVFGGYNPTATGFNSANQAQETSLQISPRLDHRFGDYGVLEIGSTIAWTNQSSVTGTTPFVAGFNPNVSPDFSNGSLTTTEEHAGFKTGSVLGRVESTTLLQAIQESGPGVLNGAHRNLAIVALGYALNRYLTPIGEIGYEDIRYATEPITKIQDAVWSVGIKATPNPNSIIILRYGHRDGFNSFFLNASYALTARTTIYARYSEALTTDLELLQNDVGLSGVDPTGSSIDTQTGAPLLLGNLFNFNGFQSSLQRTKSGSASVTINYDRDSYNLSLLYNDETPVGVAPGNVAFTSRGLTGALSWGHQLTPVLSSNAFVEYGDRTLSGAFSGHDNLFTAGIGITYFFTPSLIGNAQYLFNNRSSDVPGRDLTQNVLLFGLVKSF